MLGWSQLIFFSSIQLFYRQKCWEKKKKVKFSWSCQVAWQAFAAPHVAMAPPGSLGAPGHFRFVPALEGGGFSQPHTPNLLGYLMKQNHYRSLWQLEPHRFKAKWYLLGKTLGHFIAAGALCSGRGAVRPGWERTWLWGWWNHLFHTLSSWQPTTKPEEKWWLFKWKTEYYLFNQLHGMSHRKTCICEI